jgi:protein-S-isoprenylcysteine O-methyltransferase Ste14
VQPLVLHGGIAGVSFWGTVAGWSAWELWLQVKTVSSGAITDRGRALLFASTVAGVVLGIYLAGNTRGLPGPGWAPVALGLAIAWTGIAFRVWAVRTLGRYFTCVVVVQQDHEVIDTGPYRRVRHPSYTGLIAATFGIGIALDNWLSIPACLLPPLIGFSLRAVSEEKALARELGEPYREYMARTHRLIPGIW